MPTYDYRCDQCGRQVALFYKTYRDYDAATHTCPHCNSTELTRLISRVAIGKPTQDYTKMSSNEMLNVFEGGNPQEVGTMFKQLGQDEASLGETYHHATERLLKGDSPDKVEREIAAMTAPTVTTTKPTPSDT